MCRCLQCDGVMLVHLLSSSPFASLTFTSLPLCLLCMAQKGRSLCVGYGMGGSVHVVTCRCMFSFSTTTVLLSMLSTREKRCRHEIAKLSQFEQVMRRLEYVQGQGMRKYTDTEPPELSQTNSTYRTHARHTRIKQKRGSDQTEGRKQVGGSRLGADERHNWIQRRTPGKGCAAKGISSGINDRGWNTDTSDHWRRGEVT